MVKYPKKNMGVANNDATLIETGVEGRGPEKETIRKGTDTSVAAGHVGASNVNHS